MKIKTPYYSDLDGDDDDYNDDDSSIGDDKDNFLFPQ